MKRGCNARVLAGGLAQCLVCLDLFDVDERHLELPMLTGGWEVVCEDCVPALIVFAEVEGPPGMADRFREVWSSLAA